MERKARCARRALPALLLLVAALRLPAQAALPAAPDSLHSLCLEMKDGSVLIFRSWTYLLRTSGRAVGSEASHRSRVEGQAWCFTPRHGALGLRQRTVPLDSVRFAITDSELALPGVKTLHKGSRPPRATSDGLACNIWTGYWFVLCGMSLALLMWLVQVAL